MDNLDIGKILHTFRTSRGLSMRELAEKASLTASMLSQIEKNQVNPSINTLKSLSKALDVPLFQFFQEESDTTNLVVRKEQRKTIGLPDAPDAVFDLLTPTTNVNIEFCMMHIPEESSSGESKLSHAGEEVAYVLEGKVKILIGNRTFELEKGDSVYIPTLSSHIWYNIGKGEALVIFALTPPTF